ncbi:MAG: glycerophosphodiester phosphodiesterase, partial [Cytophagales bacterium]|nr:glycerophosphodiester phosphodiesterase [Cytophagales bacterium]
MEMKIISMPNIFKILSLGGLILISHQIVAQRISPKLDIQGHRGFRGLYPENGIEGFLRALDTGVSTLEMDVVISADSQVIVSHEPFLSAVICQGPKGELISSASEKNYNLFRMTKDSISRCDCGSVKHPGFPEQKKVFSVKPTLESVIDTVEKYLQERGLPPIQYNIETKITKQNEGKFTPNPAVFTRLVLDICVNKNIVDRMYLQSFDVRTLQEAKKRIPNLKIA